MDPTSNWAVFERLLARSQIQHAIYQSATECNDIPTSLAAVLLLGGTTAQLEAVYVSYSRHLGPWRLSPTQIHNYDERDAHLGDARFQRAYLDYFSLENNKYRGDAVAMAMIHLLHRRDTARAMLHGLFCGFGRPLTFLGDGLEVPHALMVVQSLTLACVDWNQSIHNLLTACTANSDEPALSHRPETILSNIALDGRFSGVGGPGISHIPDLLRSPAKKSAIIGYVRALDLRDIRDMSRVLGELSLVSVLLACATHKPDRFAYDGFLARLPSLVVALRVLLNKFEGAFDNGEQVATLIRGVWMLMVLAYITQLRPVVDRSVLATDGPSWNMILAGFRGETADEDGSKYLDGQFLRTLRSIFSLSQHEWPAQQDLYQRCAWSLVSRWKRWTGYGRAGEDSLNIRL